MTAWPAGTAARSEADHRSRSTRRTVTASVVTASPVTSRRTPRASRLVMPPDWSGVRVTSESAPSTPSPTPAANWRAVPRRDPGERDPAARGAEQRAAQVLRHVVQAAQAQHGAGVRRPQPLQPAHRLRGDRVGGVVQDQAGEQGPVPPRGGRGGELREQQPGQDPGRLGVAVLGQVDAHP